MATDTFHADDKRPQGAGLGLRRAFMAEFGADDAARGVDFLEVAPENWIDVGGRYGRSFRALTERFPFVCHGLSLSLGGPTPLDRSLLEAIKRFLTTHDIHCYTEHLSACTDHGHLHDLMPVPFTDDAVYYVADRIRVVQDVLERRIGVENVSYYAAPSPQMSELDFIRAVVAEADCLLLLDVNNIYVNSINFDYDPAAFLRGLPGERAIYAHVAGHVREAPDLRIDTHGATVIDPVWNLLDEAYAAFGPIPTVLERDFNLPPLADLLAEVARISRAQSSVGALSRGARGACPSQEEPSAGEREGPAPRKRSLQPGSARGVPLARGAFSRGARGACPSGRKARD